MPELSANIVSLIVITMAVGMLSFVAVATTAFAKISVVLLLVRNALGVQQTPPNMVLYGISAILAVYIAAPVALAVRDHIMAPGVELTSVAQWTEALDRAKEPMRDFLLQHARLEDRAFFLSATARVWSPEAQEATTDSDLIILIPAFLVSELTRAFEIGFLLYLPFLAVDLVVSAVLMSLGMMMVSPQTMAVPFKLFLFVVVDGWARLVQGLVLSYAPAAGGG
ncbi:type III secretion system export apparatus subunit SctR [Neomegalonema sp.]|uniref:type III secretion system export apparatus subunit SctR n=1 Tax=Neomegalonema sp. TaxID=2039713 RepID=UPI002605873A|nr:type III secretion system export apparatus subunit SctR [Neomegalonema sp.]MDD2868169.1 type III secretion system export apparatus subunit SctR [Neomegalonema sp.]